MNQVHRIAILAVAAGFLACGAAAQGLKVEFAQVFAGDENGPVRVTLKNPGRGIVGQIRSGSGVKSVLYPVELPTGSEKQVIVSRDTSYYSNTLQFEVGPRVIPAPQNVLYQEARIKSAFIHDLPDAVVQMSKAEPIKKLALGLYPAKAEDVPDRASGYDSYASVWLGEGSGRLTDSQIEAIKQYLLQGGCVVFVGGAGSTALRDARWQDVIGAKAEGLSNQRASLMDGIQAATFGRVNLSGPAWSTPQFQGMGGYKTVGDGRAMILLFSPFDQAFVNAGVASRLVAKAHTLVPQQGGTDLFYIATSSQSSESEYGYPSYETQMSSTAQSIFQYQPPEAAQLFTPVWIFALILAPLAILVPRILKRAELAWIFAPAAAIGAAVLVMNGQTALRNASLGQVTSGSIVAQEGVATSVALLHTELFFPRSGRFDLNLAPVERAEIQGGSSGFLSNAAVTYDVGARIVPPISVKNLEFRTLTTREALTGPSEWISYQAEPKGNVRVTNKSPYPVKSVRVGTGTASGPLKPGQSASVKPAGGQKFGNLIIAEFENLPLGPKIGKATSQISLKYRMKVNP